MPHKIQYNSKYVLDEETGTLTIFYAKIEDTAKYVCHAKNYNGIMAVIHLQLLSLYKKIQMWNNN